MAQLFSAILIHGYIPQELLLSTIFSIPKDTKGDLCADSNYRGISLISSLSKVMDIVIMQRNSNKLLTSELQFAHKKHHSPVMCSMALKEVVSYYMNSGTKVATCFLDSSKAFDRVRQDKLFVTLMKRGIASLDIRLLYKQYKHQRICVEWNGSYSPYFQATNGIRQGSVISPVLYCLYQDELINRLQQDGTGCWLGHHFFGCLTYADDLTLLCPTSIGLQTMIRTCESYGMEYGVNYNASKSACMMFSRGGKESDGHIYLQGNELKWTNSVKYLGSHLQNNLSESKEVAMKRGDLIGRVNCLLCNFGQAPSDILAALFNSQCCHLYGCQAWQLGDKSTIGFITMWNRCVRRVLSLPYRTHTRFLPELINAPHVTEQIFSRFVGMVKTMQRSENSKLKYLAEHSLSSPGSIICTNISYIAKRLRIKSVDVMQHNKLYNMMFDLSPPDRAAIQIIKDIKNKNIGFLTPAESDELFNYVCCN